MFDIMEIILMQNFVAISRPSVKNKQRENTALGIPASGIPPSGKK